MALKSRRVARGDLMANEVRTKLRTMILASELKAGQRLVEEDLCEMLGTGRTPVREGLLLLQGEGYLGRDRGWVVRDVDASQIRSIFESRAAIEGATARLAARRITGDECERLVRLVDAMEPADTLTRRDLNRLNTDFHGLIVAFSGNDLLAEFHERTLFFYWLLRVPVLFSPEHVAQSARQHRRILTALASRDEDEAEEAAREHVEVTLSIVEPALTP